MLNLEKIIAIETLTIQVESHGLKSGEVIIELGEIQQHHREIEKIVVDFFRLHQIKTASKQFEIIEISEKEAINSIIFGLSTKPNYTLIEKQFSMSDQNKLAYNFVQIFENPTFYSVETRLHKSDLDLSDFWESGGAIAIDKNLVGIFWTNDLYDKF